MFKIASRRVARWPVMINVPADDGKIQKFEAKVEFDILTTDEQDAIYAGGGTDRDLLERVVLGWPDGEFQDENGAPMLFNAESRATLFTISYVRQAFVASYVSAVNGREPARKN